jgi:hypothetical protein
MRSLDQGPNASAERQLDRELAEVAAAVDLVQSGRSRSVTIAGVRYGEAIVETRRAAAAALGIALEAAYGPDEDDCDIVVHLIDG